MRERIRRIFGHEQRPEKKETSSPYGYIKIGEGRELAIEQRSIYAGSVQESIQGKVSSSVVGLIKTIHEPITLIVRPPAEVKETSREGFEIQHPQEIGDLSSSERRILQEFAESQSRNNRELNDIAKQVNDLNRNLERLTVQDSPDAVKLLGDLAQRREGLKKSNAEIKRMLDEKTQRRIKPDVDTLKIEAVHKDITLTLEDPDVGVKIEDSRSKEHDIQGVAPENPKRTIELYLMHGIAHIKYPSRPKTE